jgi:hypothetical protein
VWNAPGNGSATPDSCIVSIIGPNRPSGCSAAQVDIAAVPPGRVTLRISAMAAARSGKNWSPCWHSTTSKLSSSAAMADAGHSRYSIVAHRGSCGRAHAIASMAALMSLATTRPPGPAASAASLATGPSPLATSRTLHPGLRFP